MNQVLNLEVAAIGTLAGGQMNVEVQMVAGAKPTIYRVTPTGAVGEVVAWPTADPVVVASSVPSVAGAVLGQDPHTAVVSPLAPGTSLVSITGAGQTSYINVHVVAPPVAHLSVESVG